MGEDSRSNLCKILGVEYDEVFCYHDTKFKIIIDEKGTLYEQDALYYFNYFTNKWERDEFNYIYPIINNSEDIVHHKTFTQEEIEDAEVLAKVLEMVRIYRIEGGYLWGENEHMDVFPIKDTTFLTIEDGESYTYEQIIGGSVKL